MRKKLVAVPMLALAILLALAPAAPAQVTGGAVDLDGPGTDLALKYLACAGSIAFCVVSQGLSIWLAGIACAHAILNQ